MPTYCRFDAVLPLNLFFLSIARVEFGVRCVFWRMFTQLKRCLNAQSSSIFYINNMHVPRHINATNIETHLSNQRTNRRDNWVPILSTLVLLFSVTLAFSKKILWFSINLSASMYGIVGEHLYYLKWFYKHKLLFKEMTLLYGKLNGSLNFW